MNTLHKWRENGKKRENDGSEMRQDTHDPEAHSPHLSRGRRPSHEFPLQNQVSGYPERKMGGIETILWGSATSGAQEASWRACGRGPAPAPGGRSERPRLLPFDGPLPVIVVVAVLDHRTEVHAVRLAELRGLLVVLVRPLEEVVVAFAVRDPRPRVPVPVPQVLLEVPPGGLAPRRVVAGVVLLVFVGVGDPLLALLLGAGLRRGLCAAAAGRVRKAEGRVADGACARARATLPPLVPHSPPVVHNPPPLCDIPSGCCSFMGPWTVTRSSLRMLRRVAAFCRPQRPVLLLVSFPRSRSPVVGVLGLC